MADNISMPVQVLAAPLGDTSSPIFQPGKGPHLSVPDFNEDVFLLILDGLDAWDMVRCRRVARSWRSAFTKPEYLYFKLKQYPNAREVQSLAKGTNSLQATDDSKNWQSVFDRVASRYYHLTTGTAGCVRKHKIAALDQLSQWYPVSPWDYHESQPGGRLYYENATHLSSSGTKPYLFWPTFWTYDDGLLVFAPSDGDGSTVDMGSSTPLVLLDVESDRRYSVHLTTRDAFHALNESEQVHRHFASCFDLTPSSDSFDPDTPTQKWTVSFRSEWKMHFLGLPLNSRDRFFSTHDAQHYAVYFWQPNRGMYTGDEERPLESLFVWDISHASTYHPSTDPGGRHRPEDNDGPHIVSRFSYRALEFLGLRQYSSISVMQIQLDSFTNSLIWRETSWAAGQGYFDPAERLWCARTTTFPFRGHGPHHCREWGPSLPPYRGHVSMESELLEGDEDEKWFLPVTDVLDPISGVRFALVETCFTGGTLLENRKVVRTKIRRNGGWIAVDDRLVDQVASMGRIAGDERWLIGQGRDMELVVLKF